MRSALACGLVRLCAAAAIAAGALSGAPSPARAAPPIWHVHGPTGEVTLFGSVHLLTPGLDWRSPALEADLAKADDVWFEIPMDGTTSASVNQAVQGLASLPKGQTLSSLMSVRGRERLVRVAARLGVPVAALDAYRPWFAEVTITLLDLRTRGATQTDGVEPTLAKETPPTAQRHAFETPEEQIRFLADAPVAEQVSSLEETLREIEEEPDSFAVLQNAWLTGDVRRITKEAITPLRKAAPGIYRRLVADRNRRWADEIERLLKTPERAFIIVGVGHLVGPDSVPALLRRRGLKVDGP